MTASAAMFFSSRSRSIRKLTRRRGLKEYAKKFHAGPGWVFLTGKKENLDWALYKLGQYVETKDDHKTIFIIGNEPTGLWKKAFGMANVAELVQVVESVVNDKGATQ